MAIGPPRRLLCPPGEEGRRSQFDEMGMRHSRKGKCTLVMVFTAYIVYFFVFVLSFHFDCPTYQNLHTFLLCVNPRLCGQVVSTNSSWNSMTIILVDHQNVRSLFSCTTCLYCPLTVNSTTNHTDCHVSDSIFASHFTAQAASLLLCFIPTFIRLALYA